MGASIDEKLLESFQPDRVIHAYRELKLSKWDRFSEWNDPEINIAMGADGVPFQSFEKELGRNSRNICRRIHNNSYIFYPFRELDILKKPGNPPKYRTLSIASTRDSLVQAVVYQDVLYEPVENVFTNLDSPNPVSYAYRKGKSAPKAALAVSNFIDQGYHYVFDADLSRYFDTIPHDKLLDRLSLAIGAENVRTLGLVRRFIHTDKAPYSSYKNATRKGKRVGYKVFHWRKPQRIARTAGVPQGGVLSGMLANLYLHDFDEWVVHQLGKQIDLRYVRYADDFIILLKDPDNHSLVYQEVKSQLAALGLVLNEEKTSPTALNVFTDELDFVGFHFLGSRISIQSKSIEKFKNSILDAIKILPDYVVKTNTPTATLKWMIRRINSKIKGYSGDKRCPRCGHNRNSSPRSWIAFFQVVTDIKQLQDVDKWIRQTIYKDMHARYRVRINRNQLRRAGMRSLINEKYRIPSLRAIPCLCDIDQKSLWFFSRDLFLNKRFKTLARGRQFYVSDVIPAGIEVIVGGKKSIIPKDVFLDLWEKLKLQGSLSRVDIENSGVRNTSQIFALLSEIEGVQVSLAPIKLYFDGYRPAQFLLF